MGSKTQAWENKQGKNISLLPHHAHSIQYLLLCWRVCFLQSLHYLLSHLCLINKLIFFSSLSRHTNLSFITNFKIFTIEFLYIISVVTILTMLKLFLDLSKLLRWLLNICHSENWTKLVTYKCLPKNRLGENKMRLPQLRKINFLTKIPEVKPLCTYRLQQSYLSLPAVK